MASKTDLLIKKAAEQKYVIRRKKRTKKKRASVAAGSAVRAGVGSGILTTLLNAGSKGAGRVGLTTAAIVAPIAGALSFVSQPGHVSSLHKTAEKMNKRPIQKGETLSGILSEYDDNYHGHKYTQKELLKHNPQIKDPNKIKAGGTLNIPKSWSYGRGGGNVHVGKGQEVYVPSHHNPNYVNLKPPAIPRKIYDSWQHSKADAVLTSHGFKKEGNMQAGYAGQATPQSIAQIAQQNNNPISLPAPPVVSNPPVNQMQQATTPMPTPPEGNSRGQKIPPQQPKGKYMNAS